MTKKATALVWNKDLIAPVVIASGKNLRAEQLLEIAREYNIKTVKDSILADILYDIELGSYIQPEIWDAIAAIFSFLDEGIQKKWF